MTQTQNQLKQRFVDADILEDLSKIHKSSLPAFYYDQIKKWKGLGLNWKTIAELIAKHSGISVCGGTIMKGFLKIERQASGKETPAIKPQAEVDSEQFERPKFAFDYISVVVEQQVKAVKETIDELSSAEAALKTAQAKATALNGDLGDLLGVLKALTE